MGIQITKKPNSACQRLLLDHLDLLERFQQFRAEFGGRPFRGCGEMQVDPSPRQHALGAQMDAGDVDDDRPSARLSGLMTIRCRNRG